MPASKHHGGLALQCFAFADVDLCHTRLPKDRFICHTPIYSCMHANVVPLVNMSLLAELSRFKCTTHSLQAEAYTSSLTSAITRSAFPGPTGDRPQCGGMELSFSTLKTTISLCALSATLFAANRLFEGDAPRAVPDEYSTSFTLPSPARAKR